MKSHHRSMTMPGQGATLQQVLAWQELLDSRDVRRWVEATRRPSELPSVVDIAKRDGLLTDLSRRLGC
ncbi:hypothetical protein OU426_01155 [Frigidibacter sp. RF13]|uniref:hypothetical protein n=1 Tax=Frigidibacter sp. RF13 TaxID=2997340 RepID=UPI00226F6A05|nr:hypothetical protein [Frigidibacter sp. RF13]MCY1125449.1 hypothetical protein [Frigidibacter sp. RF13]